MDQAISVRDGVRLWTDFFHSPQSPLSLAMFRIGFGTILFTESLGLLRWGGDLFGKRGIQSVLQQTTVRSDRIVIWIFRIHTVCCLCLAFGFMTRLAAALVFFNFCFRTRRNWLVIQGGDNVAKFMSLLLVFANAGGVLSIDHWLHLHHLGGRSDVTSQWPMRLMQIQVSVIYLRTVLWKLKANEWLDGSAVFYAVYRNPNVRRLFYEVGAYSWFACAPFAACLTWFTLTGELFTGIFLWFQETRNAALVVAAVMQLGFGLVFSIKQFQWLMLVSLLLFLTAQDWLTLRAAVESAWH
jgi:uncharacterized membrane protein YphA (DoxX/SURF4 family)